MKIYIASPLFNEEELNFNEELDKYLRDNGFETFLPQRDTGMGLSMEETFKKDVGGIKESDVIVFVMNGKKLDEGALVEIGMGYILGKKIIAYKSDKSFDIKDIEVINTMILGCLYDVVSNNSQLKGSLQVIETE